MGPFSYVREEGETPVRLWNLAKAGRTMPYQS